MPGSMGRRRSTNHGLPPHMARKGEAYYYVTNDKPRRRWIALGKDFGAALAAWAQLEGAPAPDVGSTLTQVAALYRRDVIPRKAAATQRDNLRELTKLESVFGESPLETIRPVDVRRYLNERVDKDGKPAPVRANREVALLSHVINFARERGLVDMHNPCLGIRKHREAGRTRYVEDLEYAAIYAKGDAPLQDAMDLLLLTSQRPSDVIKMRRGVELRDGELAVRQGKTGTKVRIAVEGDLEVAIGRMTTRERKADSVYLVADENGQPLTYWQLEERFSRARATAALELPSVADIQLRDMRGKAATDTENLAHAQALLGHKTRAMTERYVKQRRGDKVKPLTRRKGAA